jgi:formate hydrogenlyase subunit 3/multisubunit Na+/H+ antiporter MnhD subunit
VGILQHRRTDANSLRIRGLGRGLPFTGAVFLLAALGLAGVPAWGSFLGKSLIESALKAHAGYGWVHVVMTVVEVLVGAAAIAAAASTFLGWAPTYAMTSSSPPRTRAMSATRRSAARPTGRRRFCSVRPSCCSRAVWRSASCPASDGSR